MTTNIHIVGDNIDTDIIIPTEYMTLPTIAQMARFAFYPLDPAFHQRIHLGDILIAGHNFGCGSSREQAPEVLKQLGITAVIAKSFARIFYRNAINNGLLVIVQPAIVETVKQGDQLSIDLESYTIMINQKESFSLPAFPPDVQKILNAGGLVNAMLAQNRGGVAKTKANSINKNQTTFDSLIGHGLSLTEKILSAKAGRIVKAGELITIPIDRMMIHDFFSNFTFDRFASMGFLSLYDPDRIVVVYDHLIPTVSPADSELLRKTEAAIQKYGITHVHRSDGVCHQLMHEQGYLTPGDVCVGTDSHSVTYGAMGVFATGIGYTEMAAVLGTGELWFRVPETIQVKLVGKLPDRVGSKDIILEVLRQIRCDGAAYQVLEFTGPVVAMMSMDARFTLSNMSVEAGAKAGLIAPDETTRAYCLNTGISDPIPMFDADETARYSRILTIDVSILTPRVACPHNVDNIMPVSEFVGLPIQQAFLGSCTNGRLEDLEIAAKLLTNQKVHPDVRFFIVPASRKIYQDAIKLGYIKTLADAGAIIQHPSCGLCAGRSGGILENGDRIIASNNRNFLGRMGGEKVEIYLASPATVVVSAIMGCISDPSFTF